MKRVLRTYAQILNKKYIALYEFAGKIEMVSLAQTKVCG